MAPRSFRILRPVGRTRDVQLSLPFDRLDRTRPRGIAVSLTREGERRLARVVRELGDERSRLLDGLGELRK